MENRKVYTLNVVIHDRDEKWAMITYIRTPPIASFRKFTVYEVGDENPLYFVVHLFDSVWCVTELTTGARLLSTRKRKITKSELISGIQEKGLDKIREYVAKAAILVPVMPVNNVEKFLADNPPQKIEL